MTIKEMRELLGLTQSQFAQKYDIPKRSIENWEDGQRKCPDYVLKLLERAVKQDYLELAPFDSAIKKQYEDESIDGIINNRFI